MIRQYTLIPFLLFLIVALEGVAMELLPNFIKFAPYYIIPYWLLLVLILITFFLYENKPSLPIVYAIIFGLILDIVYTGILGVHMFIFAFVVYVMQLLNRVLQINLIVSIITVVVSVTLTEFLLYIIYSFIGFVSMPLNVFLINRLMVTLIANIVFMMIIYWPAKQLFLWMKISDEYI